MVAPLEQPAPPPVIQFYPYQRAFFDDDARVQVALWCRQAGKDFTTAAKAVDHALRTGQHWYIVSLTQRQADNTHAHCRRVAQALQQALRIAGRTRAVDGEEYVEYDKTIDHWFRCRARTLFLPGGGSVTALPGRSPDTLAGLTGNVIFTEFGLFPNGATDHWRVVFPLATRGFRVVVISTPRGRNTKLFDLVGDPETYSVHRVDIHRAVAEGMPLGGADGTPMTIEQFRTLYNDEPGWRREYLLQFSGDLEALLTWAQLQGAAEAEPVRILELAGDAGWSARSGDFFADMAAARGRFELGWDVARHRDLSVLWANASAGPRRRLSHLVVMKNCTFALQREVLQAAMGTRGDNVGCGDATGLGMDSNETLHARYGARWEPVTFTVASKAELGSLARTAFDDADQGIPPLSGETKWIGTDLYSIEADRSRDRIQLVTTENKLRVESHGDVFFSFALARKAAGLHGRAPQVSVG